jgi:hypothetical protein
MAGRILSLLLIVGGPIALLVLWAARSSGLLTKKIPLSAPQRQVLAKYALYYQRLSAARQRVFEDKVSLFVNEKTWVAAGISITPEMKVMISACAAQLLQGFPEIELLHFNKIVVYPESYRSQRSGRLHQGEVRPLAGMIIISWDDFVHGYAHGGDAHNVGLHEMAHALWFENTIINGEDHFLPPAALARWKQLAAEEIERIQRGEVRYLRDYAGTNQAEFFAVAVEYFFEQPAVFKNTAPELFACLSLLLKQGHDPA